jgi:putative transposase
MSKPVSYKRHRFPPEIIAYAVWLYFRFPLSLRLVEEMLLERGIVVVAGGGSGRLCAR